MHPGDRDLTHDLHAVVAPGLEGAAADELRRCGFDHVQPGRGGVRFRGSPLRANRALGIPDRIYQRVARFKCFTFEQLEEGISDLDLTMFGGLTPKVATKASRLYHTGAITERLRRMLFEGPTELLVRIDRNHCTVSVDTSGERLHRRGWRIEAGPAPLLETLAAGILAVATWRPGTALFDPMCGTGTLLIEAAVAASGRGPGARRTFTCERWSEAEPIPEAEAVPTAIAGRDRNAATLETARRNAERAEVEVALEVGSAIDATPPAERGLLVCNPPFSRRAQGAGDAFDALGALLKGAFSDWEAAIVCADPALAERLGRDVRMRCPLKNGGARIEVLLV